MRLFSRVLLRWKEPKVHEQMEYKRERHGFVRMLSVIVVASLVLIWFVNQNAPEATLTLCAVLGLLILFMCFILWVYKVFPSYVEVLETGIRQSVTDDATIWKFKDMQHCEIGKTRVGAKMPTVLVIVTKRGDRSVVGVSDAVSPGDVQEILTSKGVKVIGTPETWVQLDADDGAH
jgi:Ca2+/Na+ antiporter